jgi:hypothetical protein
MLRTEPQSALRFRRSGFDPGYGAVTEAAALLTEAEAAARLKVCERTLRKERQA